MCVPGKYSYLAGSKAFPELALFLSSSALNCLVGPKISWWSWWLGESGAAMPFARWKYAAAAGNPRSTAQLISWGSQQWLREYTACNGFCLALRQWTSNQPAITHRAINPLLPTERERGNLVIFLTFYRDRVDLFCFITYVTQNSLWIEFDFWMKFASKVLRLWCKSSFIFKVCGRSLNKVWSPLSLSQQNNKTRFSYFSQNIALAHQQNMSVSEKTQRGHIFKPDHCPCFYHPCFRYVKDTIVRFGWSNSIPGRLE